MPSDMNPRDAAFTYINMKLTDADTMTYAWGSSMAYNTGYLYDAFRPLASVLIPGLGASTLHWEVYEDGDSHDNGTDIGSTVTGDTKQEWYCPYDGQYVFSCDEGATAKWARKTTLRTGWYWFYSSMLTTGSNGADKYCALFYTYGHTEKAYA